MSSERFLFNSLEIDMKSEPHINRWNGMSYYVTFWRNVRFILYILVNGELNVGENWAVMSDSQWTFVSERESIIKPYVYFISLKLFPFYAYPRVCKSYFMSFFSLVHIFTAAPVVKSKPGHFPRLCSKSEPRKIRKYSSVHSKFIIKRIGAKEMHRGKSPEFYYYISDLKNRQKELKIKFWENKAEEKKVSEMSLEKWLLQLL